MNSEDILNNFLTDVTSLLEAFKLPKSERLSADEMLTKIRKYKETGDIEARNAVVLANLPLIRNIVDKQIRKVARKGGYDEDDLVQIGFLAIVAAIDKFDITKGKAFSTFMYKYVEGYVQNYMWTKDNNTLSLDNPLGTEGDMTFLDVTPGAYDGTIEDMDTDVDIKKLNKALDKLKPKERRIISLYYGINGEKKMNYDQIGEIYNISKQAVGQYVRAIIPKLKALMV